MTIGKAKRLKRNLESIFQEIKIKTDMVENDSLPITQWKTKYYK